MMKVSKGKRWCVVAAVASLAVLLGAIILSITMTKSAGRLEVDAEDDWSQDIIAPPLSSIGKDGSLRQSRSKKGGGRGSGVTGVTEKNAADAVPDFSFGDVLSASTRSGLRSRCAENESLARVELNTDRYSWETSWELLDRRQKIIVSGPPEGSNYARENRLVTERLQYGVSFRSTETSSPLHYLGTSGIFALRKERDTF